MKVKELIKILNPTPRCCCPHNPASPSNEAVPPRLALAEDDALHLDKQPLDHPASDVMEDVPASNTAEVALTQSAPPTSVPTTVTSSTQPRAVAADAFAT